MKTRIIAAVALLPLLLAIVLFAPKVCTAILFALIAAVAAYELLVGTDIEKSPRLVLYSAVMAVMTSLWSYFGWPGVWTQLLVLLFFVVLFAEIMMSGMKLPFLNVIACFAAGLLIPYLLTALVRIHITPNGRFFILIPFVMAFLSDTGAYFFGLAFGKHKLAPTISPKKTVEGAVGGIVGAVVGMVLYCLVLQMFFDFTPNYIFALIYGVVGSACAVFGDLCFSVIKRQTGIKDYGNLIPGHGGILDRFDSMVVVAPVAEILLILLPLAV